MIRMALGVSFVLAVLFAGQSSPAWAWQKSKDRVLVPGAKTRPWGKPSIGVFYSRFSDPKRRISGVVVDSVWKNGPADRAGLMVDDMIVSADRKLIRKSSQLTEIIAAIKPGKSLLLRIKRPEKRKSGAVIYKSLRLSMTPVTLTEALVASSEISTFPKLERPVVKFLSLASERDPDGERISLVYIPGNRNLDTPGILRHLLTLSRKSSIEIPADGAFRYSLLFVNPLNNQLQAGGFGSKGTATVETNSAGNVRAIYLTSAKVDLFTKIYKMHLRAIRFTLPSGPAKAEASQFDIRQMALIRSLTDDLPKLDEYIRKNKKTK